MANRKRIVINVDLEAQVKDFEKAINKAKETLRTLSSGMSGEDQKQFSKTLTALLRKVRDIKDVAENGFMSDADFNTTQKKIKGLKDEFVNWIKDLKGLNLDPEDILPTGEKAQELKEINKQIERYSDNIKKLKSEIRGRKKNTDAEAEMAELALGGHTKLVSKRAKTRRAEITEQIEKLQNQGVAKDLTDAQEQIKKYQEAQTALSAMEGKGKGKDKLTGETFTQQRQNLRQIIADLKDVIPQLKEYIQLQGELERLSTEESFYKSKAQDILNSEKEQKKAKGNKNTILNEAKTTAEEKIKNLENLNTEGVTATENLNNVVDEQQAKFEQLNNQAKNMDGLKSYFNSLVSATAIYMRLRQAVIGAFNDFKEIDSELNAISIVTGKTMKELWGNFGNLNSIAQQYGVTTKNVIEVQKLYYQQGRNAVEVTQLTGETLKFAKISGLDFANATDYMTAALNAYNIAAKDASEITDTYAALSAAAAVDSQEVAVAMSKVASMAATGGSSFKDTSAYLSKIIETTRESAETAGTSLKTVLARFTEIDKLTEDQQELLDEDYNFNNIEKALKMIGVQSKDSTGQLRSFSDIINELGEKWDTLDTNMQHYIATQAAGSR